MPDVYLPTGYYLGFSAATGDLADNHDIISIQVAEPPKLTVEEVEEMQRLEAAKVRHSADGGSGLGITAAVWTGIWAIEWRQRGVTAAQLTRVSAAQGTREGCLGCTRAAELAPVWAVEETRGVPGG